MIGQDLNMKVGVKLTILIFTVLICSFLITYIYFSKSTIYYDSGVGNTKPQSAASLVKKSDIVTPGVIPPINSDKTPIDSPSVKDWITTNNAISFIEGDKKNILSIKSIAPFNSSGQSYAYEIITNEGLFAVQYVITEKGITDKATTSAKSEKIKPFPLDVPDSSIAVKNVTSNPYFADRNLLGVVIYYDAKLKSWKYIIRTDVGDVSIPI